MTIPVSVNYKIQRQKTIYGAKKTAVVTAQSAKAAKNKTLAWRGVIIRLTSVIFMEPRKTFSVIN